MMMNTKKRPKILSLFYGLLDKPVAIKPLRIWGLLF